MSLQQKIFTIVKTEYCIREFDADENLFWFATLMQLGSGALLGVSDFPKSGNLDNQDINIGQAVRGLITHLSPSEFARLSKKMYAESVIRPEFDDDKFKHQFGGRGFEDLLKLMGYIVLFNFEHLFPTLKKTLHGLTGLSFSQTDKPNSEGE